MAFVNERPDSDAITALSTEEQNDMLKAFATGSTIETIAEVKGLTCDEVTTFLNNRTDEILALKDYLSKVLAPVTEEVNEINTRAVYDNEHKRN